MSRTLPSSCTVIATTGERFQSFAPYVASVNDAGTVAFQAALRDGGSGVYSGTGGDVVELAGPSVLAGVTSHPDVNNGGATSFYADLQGGGQGVCLLRGGTLQAIADTRGGFAAIGPLGPTMNESGSVAFRGERAPGIAGIFMADDAGVRTVADTRDGYRHFHGLPVIDERGGVVFRADRADGVEGIYTGDGQRHPDGRRDRRRLRVAVAFPLLQRPRHPRVRGDYARPSPGDRHRGRGGHHGRGSKRRVRVVSRRADRRQRRRRGPRTPRGGNLGLFTGPDPDADRILGIGDDRLGSTVTAFAANPVSINAGGQLAVNVTLADGRELILKVRISG